MASLVALAARVFGGAAVPLAEGALRYLRLPDSCGVASLLVPCRSPPKDAETAGCALVDGECVCDLSAPRGCRGQCLRGYGVMSDLGFFDFNDIVASMHVRRSHRVLPIDVLRPEFKQPYAWSTYVGTVSIYTDFPLSCSLPSLALPAVSHS